MEVLQNHIMDTEIPEQLQKVEIERQSGPLTTKEIQLDETHRIYICKGCITGNYPICIPLNTLVNQKLVANSHIKNLQGEWATQWQRSEKDSGFQSYVSSQNVYFTSAMD